MKSLRTWRTMAPSYLLSELPPLGTGRSKAALLRSKHPHAHLTLMLLVHRSPLAGN